MLYHHKKSKGVPSSLNIWFIEFTLGWQSYFYSFKLSLSYQVVIFANYVLLFSIFTIAILLSLVNVILVSLLLVFANICN